MKVPSEEECFKLMDAYCLPGNVREHSLVVAKIALLIADKFNEHGKYVDSKLVYSSSLLHDLFKPLDFYDLSGFPPECVAQWKDLKKRCDASRHPEAAYKLLKDDFPEVAKIIRKHDYKAVIAEDDDLRPITWEEKIVTYADKRVAHSKVVSLKERFSEGHKRWKGTQSYNPGQAELIDGKYYELEKEIFSNLPFGPEKINELIDKNG